MKRLYVVMVPTVLNAFKVSCLDVFKRIFIISVGSREDKNIAEFLRSRTSLFFGYAGHIQRQVPFFVINLCKLFFFERIKSAFKLGFNSGGSPMKRTLAVIISAVFKAGKIACLEVWDCINISVGLRQFFKLSKFVEPFIALYFGHSGVFFYPASFANDKFKNWIGTLSYFKRHTSNHRTNFRKVNHLNSEDCHA